MSEQQKPIIQLQGIGAAYDDKTVLTDVNMTIRERDFLGIIGPNGGGKTTLLKLILGLKKPAAGSILFFRNGVPVPNIKMGYMPQYNAIDKKFPISVYEVILSGLSGEKRLFRRYTAAQHERVRAMVAHVGLAAKSAHSIEELSGGELQRALLGRALVSEPDVVILDEPNTYLDRHFEAQLYKLLDEANGQRAVILVSHDIGTVLQNVKAIACVNGTLDYHPDTGSITGEWLEERFGCPLDIIGHGTLPHRVLKCHEHDE